MHWQIVIAKCRPEAMSILIRWRVMLLLLLMMMMMMMMNDDYSAMIWEWHGSVSSTYVTGVIKRFHAMTVLFDTESIRYWVLCASLRVYGVAAAGGEVERGKQIDDEFVRLCIRSWLQSDWRHHHHHHHHHHRLPVAESIITSCVYWRCNWSSRQQHQQPRWESLNIHQTNTAGSNLTNK